MGKDAGVGAPLEALRDELVTDPERLGYDAMGDEEAAAALNAPTRERTITTVSHEKLLGCVAASAAKSLSVESLLKLLLVFSRPVISLKGPVGAILLDVFGQAASTKQAIVQLLEQKEAVSRADELGWPAVTPSDVADARRLP